MPYAIDEEAARKQMNWNISRPQEVVIREPDGSLRKGWIGTAAGGLPVKQIPFFPFPVVLYMWPVVPTRTILHRNDRHEIVHEEEIPLEHLTKVICCDAHKNGGPEDCVACNKELESALSDGWTREPYIAKAPDKSDADLYGPRKKK